MSDDDERKRFEQELREAARRDPAWAEQLMSDICSAADSIVAEATEFVRPDGSADTIGCEFVTSQTQFRQVRIFASATEVQFIGVDVAGDYVCETVGLNAEGFVSSRRIDLITASEAGAIAGYQPQRSE